MSERLLELFHPRRGHFLLESGHHGDLWLDLERLCEQPRRLDPWIATLAAQLAPYAVDAVCSPLVEGAMIGLLVARRLNVTFFYSAPIPPTQTSESFYPVSYRVPVAQRASIAGKRIAVVNDVINAGSAVRGTLIDLQECRVSVCAVAALMTLGETPQQIADHWHLPLLYLAHEPNLLWTPAECPLCVQSIPLE